MNKNQKNIENRMKNTNSNNIANDLEIERKNKKSLRKSGYDFVPRIDHWTSIDEQKIKADEIEKITDEK